jgi:hypothetical protein
MIAVQHWRRWGAAALGVAAIVLLGFFVLLAGACWTTAGAAIRSNSTVSTVSYGEGLHNLMAGRVILLSSSAVRPSTDLSPFGAFGSGPSRSVLVLAPETENAAGAEAESDAQSCSLASSPNQSFTPTTEVRLASGDSIPLDQVKVGDEVLATNPQTGKTQAEPVTAVWVNHDSDLLDLTVHTNSGDTVVDTTQHHLFYDLTTHSWVQAEQLHPGDQLYTADGSLATVVGSQFVRGAADMWDLTVANDHDFYINVFDQDVLVHNIACRVSPVGPDWATKGAHLNLADGGEVRVFPNSEGGIGGEGIRLSTGTASEAQVQSVLDQLSSDPTLRSRLIDQATSAMETMNSGGNWGYETNRGAEMYFLIKALQAGG